MRIGVDIDDVLYKTSIMIVEQSPKIMQKLGITQEPDFSKYSFKEMFHVDHDIDEEVTPFLLYNSSAYLNPVAIRAIKTHKHLHPEDEIVIVTKRSQKDATIIRDYIVNLFYYELDGIYSVPDEVSKAGFCERNGIDILFDDYEKNIQEFPKGSQCIPILVSTEHVLHNKEFAENYPRVLWDWNDFEEVLYGK